MQKNVKKGLRILRESCVDNSTIGWNLLGDCYRHGYGVQKNAKQAANYYTKATNANVGMRALNNAHASLADMYMKGEGLDKSREQAVYHLMYAADRYDSAAQYKVALLFEVGNGVDQHIDRAVLYFKLSARGGNALAQLKSGEYVQKGQGVEHPRKLEIDMLEQAAEQGHTGARNLLRKITNRFKRIKSM